MSLDKEIKKYFLLKSDLKQKQDYKCRWCNNVFNTDIKLQDHLDSVCRKGLTVYECNLCEFTCKRRRNLVRHKRRKHNVFISVECTICHKTFKTPEHLGRHNRNVHSRKVFKCDTCDKDFKCNKYLKAHQKNTCHSLMLKCKECDKLFKNNITLTKHIKNKH